MNTRRLVADIGGTNTRFGVSSGAGELSNVRIYPTAEQQPFADVLAGYLAELGAGPPASWCTGAHIAAAGVVDKGHVMLTNASWRISADEVSRTLGDLPVRFANDLEAVALLLPHLGPADVAPIGPVTATDLVGNRLAVNIGTGFGAATAVRVGGDGWTIAASEAGHMSLDLSREAADLSWCETVEDVLSGLGIARLYESVAKHTGFLPGASGATDRNRHADAVFAHADADPVAQTTVRILSRIIGDVTGNLVLSTAAWEGVFLCGSVARAWLRLADVPLFRFQFEHKGPMSDRMARVPTYAIVPDEPALLGLTYGNFKNG